MKLKFLTPLLLLLLSVPFAIQAQMEPPVIRCIALDEADDVTIHWSIPTDTANQFLNYHVYYRQNQSAAFTLLSIIANYSQDSIKVIGSFSGKPSFYMETVFNPGTGIDTSRGSDTLEPILLAVTSANEVATISWDEVQMASIDSIYRIRRRINSGPFLQIGTTEFDNRLYRDSLDPCYDTVTYNVEILGLTGCANRSNFYKELVIDDTPPDRTDLYCLSVDTATGFVNYEWERSPSKDVLGYLATFFSEFKWNDTIFGSDSLQAYFTKKGIDAQTEPETISIAPFDSCLSPITNWYNQAADNLRMVTLFGSVVDFNVCDGWAELAWNKPRDRYPVGVRTTSFYELYMQRDTMPAEKVATIPASDSTYFVTGLSSGETYHFYLVVTDNEHDKSAMSNRFRLVLTPPDPPNELYIHSIRADAVTDENLIYVQADSSANSIGYRLYRAFADSDEFIPVARFVEEGTRFRVRDETSKADQTSYKYYMAALDECEDESIVSNRARSMFLNEVEQEDLYQLGMEWNHYNGFDSTNVLRTERRLIRQVAGLDDEDMPTAFRDSTYVDDLEQLEQLGGEICYVVEEKEAEPNSFGITGRSVSNRLCFVREPVIHMPNAFSPDGDNLNDVFRPLTNFIDPVNYSLVIYNRQGQVVFSTTDPSEGWDGEGWAIGVYAYRMEFFNARNEPITWTGKLYLIR